MSVSLTDDEIMGYPNGYEYPEEIEFESNYQPRKSTPEKNKLAEFNPPIRPSTWNNDFGMIEKFTNGDNSIILLIIIAFIVIALIQDSQIRSLHGIIEKLALRADYPRQ